MRVQSIDLLTDHTTEWRSFAKCLFKLEDADPGYVLLKRAKLGYDQKLRYVLAWCTFYNVGIAAQASEYRGAAFYDYLTSVYPTAKRASERRHFRGQAGLTALHQWRTGWPQPEGLIERCYAPTYLGVRANMKDIAQMGDYFYWKLADIWDTVFDRPVDFTGCEKYMPKVPKQGAEIISELESTCHALEVTMSTITDHVKRIPYTVKPRKLALQEAETVCCVFKQHVVGDYMYGYRSAKAWKRLSSVPECKTAKKLLDGLYAGGIWNETNLSKIEV